MTHESAPRRSLESLKKEAKRWRDALRANDPAARERLVRALPEAPASPALRDVQHALAREHGFNGWTELTHAIGRVADPGASTLARYEAMAEALLEAFRTGTPEAMERHYRYTWHRRAWPAMRTYVLLDLGKRPAHPGEDLDITLDDARRLVAREYGFADWDQLAEFTSSPAARRRVTLKPMRLVERQGAEDWRPVASSRDWEELLALLAQHPAAGLSAEGQMSNELLADLARVQGLTALGLSGCREVTDAGIAHLARLSCLEHLDLSGTSITDAALEAIARLSRLRTLSLAWTRVTAAGMAHLARCDSLERINLLVMPSDGARWPADAGDAAVRALAGKRHLHHLEIALSDDGIHFLHELPVFKSWQGGEASLSLLGPHVIPNHISLRGPFTRRGLSEFRGLDGLFSLDIDDGGLDVDAEGLGALAALAHLEALRVDADVALMAPLARLPRLRHLSIQDTPAGDDGFEALSRSRSIEYIWGRRCQNLRRRGFQALSRMPSLRGLSVSCLNVDDEGVAALPSFPALRELMPMDIRDAGYRHIGRCSRLESLILMYCRDTTDAATEHITGLDRLSYYFNSYTTITDRTPQLLSAMDSLERITFDTCHHLTNAGVSRLARLPKLGELRVSGGRVTSALKSAFPARVRVFVGE